MRHAFDSDVGSFSPSVGRLCRRRKWIIAPRNGFSPDPGPGLPLPEEASQRRVCGSTELQDANNAATTAESTSFYFLCGQSLRCCHAGEAASGVFAYRLIMPHAIESSAESTTTHPSPLTPAQLGSPVQHVAVPASEEGAQWSRVGSPGKNVRIIATFKRSWEREKSMIGLVNSGEFGLALLRRVIGACGRFRRRQYCWRLDGLSDRIPFDKCHARAPIAAFHVGIPSQTRGMRRFTTRLYM